MRFFFAPPCLRVKPLFPSLVRRTVFSGSFIAKKAAQKKVEPLQTLPYFVEPKQDAHDIALLLFSSNSACKFPLNRKAFTDHGDRICGCSMSKASVATQARRGCEQEGAENTEIKQDFFKFVPL
jgi:hypothetical protein